ncbi:MAG: DUF1844 domain-containing protein [Desulfobacteraceae bacterium]|nr:DUF1844 domain-containing protein [Desulfobacteraceae bacterium]
MAEQEEDKGFKVKDRRRFSTDEPDAGSKPEEQAAQAPEDRPGAEGPDAGDDRGPLPEVSMATFIFSLSSSALMHLGEIAEPGTNRTIVDLPIAKQIIDTLGMLQEKTKGNLDPDEDKLLSSVLYDLRMRYVHKQTGKKQEG